MDNNWIVENLTNAFTTWNSKMTEMWSLLTESPQTFKGGTIWQTIVTINGGMQAIGYGLLVLFLPLVSSVALPAFGSSNGPSRSCGTSFILCWRSWELLMGWTCW